MTLTGIARLAAQGPLLESKKRVEYFQIETRSLVGRCSGTRMPFVWTVNPYRGCEFGCKYCYARYAHEFMELRDPLQFERKIYAKQFSPEALRRELGRTKPGEQIWIGTATDPYQPAEARYRVTRRILETLAAESGLDLGITTKSALIRRDAELLGEVGRRNRIHINMTVTTLDPALAQLVEPMASRPWLRLKAVEALTRNGVRVTVLANPVMPLINDSEASLDAVCKASREAGAASFSAAPLFLKPCAAQVFFPFLETHYPHLLRKYRERYSSGAYLKGAYPETIRERVARIVERHQMRPRFEEPSPLERPQMELF